MFCIVIAPGLIFIIQWKGGPKWNMNILSIVTFCYRFGKVIWFQWFSAIMVMISEISWPKCVLEIDALGLCLLLFGDKITWKIMIKQEEKGKKELPASRMRTRWIRNGAKRFPSEIGCEMLPVCLARHIVFMVIGVVSFIQYGAPVL